MTSSRLVVGLIAVATFVALPKAVTAGGILSSVPPDGAIDGRQPHAAKDIGVRLGWQSISIMLDTDASAVTRDDFSISISSGTTPTVAAVFADGRAVEVLLNRPIPAGAWTTLTYEPDGASVRLGYLPGDVDGSGYAGPVDILRLVDVVNGVGDPLPTWSTDIDRSGVVDAADIATLRAMLSGRSGFERWGERALPGVWQNVANRAYLDRGGVAGGVGGAVVELVPSSTTLPLGGSVTVEVFMTQTGGPDPILARMVQLDFSMSDPALALSTPGTYGTIVEMFDFGSATGCPGTCGTAHAIDPEFPVVSAAYGDATHLLPDASLQMNLFDGVQTKIAEVLVEGSAPGTYTLDAMNADASGNDDGAWLIFGFGTNIDGIPITTWRATEGDLTGGTLVLEVMECALDLDCDDQNPCTDDVCVDGVCDSTPDNSNDPDDGLYCNGVEGWCDDGTIIYEMPAPDCDDGLVCTSDFCDEDEDRCVGEVLVGFCAIDGDCHDNGSVNSEEPCQICLWAGNPTGWSEQPDGTPCPDGVFCNGPETCVSGVCLSGTAPDCDDGLDCTSDSCDSISDLCRHDPVNNLCDDGQFCNGIEMCSASVGCVSGEDPCPPDSVCDEVADVCVEGAIPTVSNWGLAVLTLCMLVGGKIGFGRRRAD